MQFTSVENAYSLVLLSAQEKMTILLNHSTVQGVGHRFLLAIGWSGHNKPRKS
jgi:hypothetical protein